MSIDKKKTAMALPKQVVPPELSSFIASLCTKLWHAQGPNDNKATPLPPILATPPFSQTPASFDQWVHRVLSTTNVPLAIVFLSLFYIHRFRSTIPPPPPGSEFIVFIAGLMVAMKSPQGCDNTYTNKGWNRISKVPLHLLNAMELQMLISLRFDVWVSEQNFSVWLQYVEAAIVQQTGQPANNLIQLPIYPKRQQSLFVDTARKSTVTGAPIMASYPSPASICSATSSTGGMPEISYENGVPSPAPEHTIVFGHHRSASAGSATSTTTPLQQHLHHKLRSQFSQHQPPYYHPESASYEAARAAIANYHPSPPSSNFGSPHIKTEMMNTQV
ncbi:hypothetical protein HDU97_006640 [Phlyctochytrium planicorne]|nr:hypothetical protein HDU97_006640 [Phlyctochytrium planicorne]